MMYNTQHTTARTKIEALEDRRMMSTSVLTDGVLMVNGDAHQANRINLSLAPGGTEVQVSDSRGLLQRVALEEVKRIEVRGGMLRDVVKVSPKLTVGTTIYGGAGNDRISAGSGTDVIYGELGDDHITLSYGDHVVDDQGSNTIVRTGAPLDNIPDATGAGVLTAASTASAVAGEAQVAAPAWRAATAAELGTTQAVVSPSISRVVLVNAGTDRDVTTLTEGATINLANYSGGINLRAVTSASVKSVKFGLDANSRYRVQNSAPFTIGNDNGWGQYYSWRPTVGTHTVKVTGYTGVNLSGTASATKTITFKVINQRAGTSAPAPAPVTSTPPPAPAPSTGSIPNVSNVAGSTPNIVSFVLVDPTTNKPVRVLREGDKVNLNAMAGGNINIQAVVTTATKSVRFGWNSNASYRLEVGGKFTLCGDRDADYWSMVPSLGLQKVTATAYGSTNGTGTGYTKSLSFTVVREPLTVIPASSYDPKVPTTAANNGNVAPVVSFINPHNGDKQAYPGHYVVRVNANDSDGKVAKVEFFANGNLFETTTDAPYSAPWINVAPGDYSLTARVTDNRGASTTSTIKIVINTVSGGDTYYVSTSGRDSNSGASTGSAFRTIGHAASRATAGDTIIVLPGTYRESITMVNSGTSDKPITFKAQQRGTVYIDGSDQVKGWNREGSSNVYSASWSKDFFYRDYQRHHDRDSRVGFAENFIHNGQRLTQVTSKSALSAGEFYVDWGANKVFVWLNGNADARNTTIYGGTRQSLMTTSSGTTGKFVTLDGINFRNAANFAQEPAVRTNDGWVVKNARFEDMSNGALGVRGDNTFIYNNTFANNGHVGMSGGGSNSLMVNNEVYGNNARKYSWGWESGGAKLTRSVGLYVLNYNGYENYGAGLWLDIFNTDFVIKGGYFHNAKPVDPSKNFESLGIFSELNTFGRIEGASFYGNLGAGLCLAENQNVIARGNFMGDNLEVRNMEDRALSTKNLRLESNKFENAKVISSIGALYVSSFRTLNITANNSVFDNGSNDWYNWKGVKTNSGEETYDAFGVDRTAKSGYVSIPRD